MPANRLRAKKCRAQRPGEVQQGGEETDKVSRRLTNSDRAAKLSNQEKILINIAFRLCTVRMTPQL
jgi:hypothetical protein